MLNCTADLHKGINESLISGKFTNFNDLGDSKRLDGSEEKDSGLSIKQRLLHEHIDKDLDPESNELLHGSSAIVEEEHKESSGNNHYRKSGFEEDEEPIIGEAELSML